MAGSNSGAVCASSNCATDKVRAVFGLHVIAYNLIRLGNLQHEKVVAQRCGQAAAI
jgi:hypothetical protein